jgi:hypothetical protein
LAKAREVYQTAPDSFGNDEEQIDKVQAVFNALARMQTQSKDYGRARAVYMVRPATHFLSSGSKVKRIPACPVTTSRV